MGDDQNLTNTNTDNSGNDQGQNSEQVNSGPAGKSAGSSDAKGTSKKPKTDRQRERERERRRRRRRKKVTKLSAGQDVPLILRSEEGKERGRGAKDATLHETPGVAEELASHAHDIPKIPDLTAEEHMLSDIPGTDEQSEDKSQENLAESSVAEIPSEPVEQSESSEEISSEIADEAKVGEPEQIGSEPTIEPGLETELNNAPEDVEAATSEAESSLTEPVAESPIESPLDEPIETVADLPVPPAEYSPSEESSSEAPESPLDHSQQVFEESPSYEEPEPEEVQPEVIDAPPVEELPMLSEDHDEEAHADLLSEDDLEHVKRNEAKNLVQDLHAEESTHLEEVPQKQWILGNLLKTLGGIVAVILLIIGAFWLGSSLHLPDILNSWFTPKPGEELVQGDNTQVVQDPEMFRRWGFQTAQIMSRNLGDVRDLTYNVFFNANYFGKLREPVFYGETGVTAALYYGFGREAQYLRNKFIYYVKYLAQVRQANQVKVADVLDGKLRRDQALDAYIAELKAIFEQGNTLRKEINVQIDELKVSINSLNPDKDRYEVDFFASLAETEAEKADALILQFIEVTQKQTDLKAKLAAMTKLSEYYEEDLIAMKLRIEGLEQNRDALIEGVTIREVPGSGIDLIRE